MNTKEKIKIMQAWLDGKTIGWDRSPVTWTNPIEPNWHPDYTYYVVEPLTKFASEWFMLLPEHIQWALPEYEDDDAERKSLKDAVCCLPDWSDLPQGHDFWTRVANGDYPSRAETVLATWKGEKVRHKNWHKGDWFEPLKLDEDGDVEGINQDGNYDFWLFAKLEEWEVYTEPERVLIDPVRLLGKILLDELGRPVRVITDKVGGPKVAQWSRQGYQWSDTVDSERHSMWVEK